MPIMNQNNPQQYRVSPYGDKQSTQQQQQHQQQVHQDKEEFEQHHQPIPKPMFLDSNSINLNTTNSNGIKDDSNVAILDSDPSVYQLLQTAIQLIYQTRSKRSYSSSSSSSSSLHSNQDIIVPDVFNIKGFEGGLFQSKNLNINDLGPLIDKDIHLEYVEINEINRDLTLWCDHILSSPLKIDIFLCTFNSNTNEYVHTLLERWMFTFTPIDFTQHFNKNLLISSPSPPKTTTSVNTTSTTTTTTTTNLTNLLTTTSNDNIMNIDTPMKSKNNHNNDHPFNLSPLSPPNHLQGYSNSSTSELQSSLLIKSLYYVLSSMPLYQCLKKQQQMTTSSTLVPQLPKIKYGISQNFPPPFNYRPDEYPNLVKLNFPPHEISFKGSISLSVQFPNISMPIIDGSTSSIVIYPSRSCSSNLICHCIPTTTTTNSATSPLPSLSDLIKQKAAMSNSTTTTTKTRERSKPILQSPISLSTSSSSSNKKSQSTSPSSAPISIPKSPLLSNTTTPITTPTKVIDINNNNNGNNNNNNHHMSPLKLFSNNSNQQPQQQQQQLNNSQLTPPQFSPVHFKSFPYSPTSPPLHSFSLINSPPSSPYRVGSHRRTLFFDGLSPSSIGSGSGSNNNNNSFSGFLTSPNQMAHGSRFIKSPSESSFSPYGSFNGSGSGGGNFSINGGGYNTTMSFGSFQESILTGNMSNTPSTKFDGYLADLGVCGKDYIPPHKKISFSSLFYHIDHDTPYVADIDIGEKGFRVPSKGLIQLTLFNPFNTPIKTFLVNFDLSDMGNDTKTFIRQKIISFNNTNNNNNNSNNQSTTSLSTSYENNSSNNLSLSSLNISNNNHNNNNSNNNINNNENNNILKYAIHLRFVCVKKRKYYLYKNIRVVFPNRIPDEMEKLKIVYEYPPEPKYFPL